MLEKTAASALVSVATQRIEVDHDGTKVVAEVWPLTWERRKKAESASTDYYRENGKLMYRRDVSKFEVELLKLMVKDTNIPDVPGIGWMRLDPEVGTKLFDAIMELYEPTEEEDKEAKNSSGEGRQPLPVSVTPPS